MDMVGLLVPCVCDSEPTLLTTPCAVIERLNDWHPVTWKLPASARQMTLLEPSCKLCVFTSALWPYYGEDGYLKLIYLLLEKT